MTATCAHCRRTFHHGALMVERGALLPDGTRAPRDLRFCSPECWAARVAPSTGDAA